jgi:signal peptidase I
MRRAVLVGAVAAVAVAAGRALARLEPVLVAGESMLPTLQPGQRVAVGPLRRPPARGELVLLRRPGPHRPGDHPGGPPDPPGPPLELVKRVVGLPGERVRLAAGRLEVDGRPVPEPYLGSPRAGGPPAGAFEVALGPGEYLVLGDARDASTDGRAFGPVGADALAGRVRFAYWPPRLRI